MKSNGIDPDDVKTVGGRLLSALMYPIYEYEFLISDIWILIVSSVF